MLSITVTAHACHLLMRHQFNNVLISPMALLLALSQVLNAYMSCLVLVGGIGAQLAGFGTRSACVLPSLARNPHVGLESGIQG